MQILVDAVTVRYNDKHITIRRLGVGYYYRLLACINNLHNLQDTIASVLKQSTAAEMVQAIKNNALEIAKRKAVNLALRQALQPFIKGYDVIKAKDITALLKLVLQHNSQKTESESEPGEVTDLVKKPDYEGSLNRILYLLAKITGLDPIECADKYNNVQAQILIEQYDKDQYEQAALMRMAQHADANDWRKFRARIFKRKLLKAGSNG